MELHQLDVKTAFLNGELEKDIFMVHHMAMKEEDLALHAICRKRFMD